MRDKQFVPFVKGPRYGYRDDSAITRIARAHQVSFELLSGFDEPFGNAVLGEDPLALDEYFAVVEFRMNVRFLPEGLTAVKPSHALGAAAHLVRCRKA